MAEVAAGTVVGGKYRLVAPIGRGGMASVWRATHTTLEHSLAIKLLETFGTSRDKMAKRFLREAKLAAGLTHRNVVHILDYGVMDDGQPFMAMELLEGLSLQDRLDNGPPVSPLELLDTMAMVLGGLAAVHDAGIVHRDVKPDNIFLVRDSDGDFPKLLDFGISRGAEASGPDSRVTNTGAVVGTPYYMSPEQARGVKDLDHRTDLWSVGIILYEALTGDVPFMAENMGDVLIRVATTDAPSVAEARPDLPDEVVTLVDRALARDRTKRWTDARSMRQAVVAARDAIKNGTGTLRQRALATRQVAAVAPKEATATGEVPAVPARRRWPLVVAGASVAALASFAVAFIALGGEIRFSSAAAEPQPAASPPPEERSEPEATEVERPAVREPAAPAETAVASSAIEVETPPAPTPEPRTQRTPRRVVQPPAATPPTPTPAEPPRERPRERPPQQQQQQQTPPPQQQQRGGFLRDLDY